MPRSRCGKEKGDMAGTRKKHTVIVVGAGASGMAAALVLAKNKIDVALLEANDVPGKKILATGNGKCNFTNYFQSPECYRGEQPGVAMELLKRYDPAYVLRFFEWLGILSRQRDGYYYPNTGQAATVRDAFVFRLLEFRVPIYQNTHVDWIKKEGTFQIAATYREKLPVGKGQKKAPKKPVFSGNREIFFEADYVILATGGCAGNIRGADGSGYALAAGFGHHIIPVVPALVQLILAPPKPVPDAWKTLSGLRMNAELLLRIIEGDGSKKEWRERGEILFTDYGLSGIPAMQVSRFAARELAKGDSHGRVLVELDFFPDIRKEELCQKFFDRMDQIPGRSLPDFLLGVLPPALNEVMIAMAGIRQNECLYGNREERMYCARMVSETMKQFSAVVEGTKGFEQAQVTAGGVAMDELCGQTMESRLVRGLYVTGELADMDGTCGGYNLQWAWMSAFAAAEAICGKEGK